MEGTSQMVEGQISIAHTFAYTLIDSRDLHSFMSAVFVKKLDVEPVMLEEVCVVSMRYSKVGTRYNE